MRIAMIGTGYVGLVSGACFSEFGTQVVCVDNNGGKIERLSRGEVPIFEPGLDDLVARNVEAGRLLFTTDLTAAVQGCNAVFIAVGTPTRRGDGHADLRYVYAVAEQVAEALDGPSVVVTKSTVPVGTGHEIAGILRRVRGTDDVALVSNPEFLREGSAITDFMRPDRVVIGVEDEAAREVMHALYRPLYLNETPILFTTLEASELIKYAANAFLATKITFMNEMADLCERVGCDVHDVAKGIGLDGRIGGKFLHPGPGYGGSCFPKDTAALTQTAQDVGAPLRIVETVMDVNAKRKRQMAQRIIAFAGGEVKGKTVAILGLTFKPNTDDMRESPALDIVPSLIAAGAVVKAHDPEGMDEAAHLIHGATFCQDAYSAILGADLAVILTEWNQFRNLDLGRMKKMMREAAMIDLRNVYDPAQMAAAGFRYESIGRPRARAADPEALTRRAPGLGSAQ